MSQRYDTIGGGAGGFIGGGLSGVAAGAPFGPIGMIAGGLLGGIFGSKGTKVPKPPTYSEMLNSAIKGQEGIQDELLSLEAKRRPQYQKLTEDTYMTQMFGDGNNLGYLELMNRAREGSREYENAATLDELNTIKTLSPIARDAMMSQGQKDLQGSLMSDAMTRMSAGTNLGEEDRYMAAQRARKAMAARGLGGRQGVAAEVLENNSLGINRRDSAIQAAYNALKGETTFQNQANAAAQGGKDTVANYAKMFSGTNFLSETDPRIFNPQDSMNIQASGNQYQHGMAMGRSKLASQQGLLNSLGSFGKFAAANPNMFSFGSSAPDFSGSGAFASTLGFGRGGAYDSFNNVGNDGYASMNGMYGGGGYASMNNFGDGGYASMNGAFGGQ